MGGNSEQPNDHDAWEDDEEFEASILYMEESHSASQSVTAPSRADISCFQSRIDPTPKQQPVQQSDSTITVTGRTFPLCSTPINRPNVCNMSAGSASTIQSIGHDVFTTPKPAKLSTTQRSTTAPTEGRTKRKFPGPAGTLPKLRKDVDLRSLKCQELNTHTSDEEELPEPSSQCSQPLTVSSNAAYRKIMTDMEISSSHLKKHCIKNAVTNGAKKCLPEGKVPLLVAVIENINKLLPDASATLTDPTGSIPCVIHRMLVKQYPDELKTGAALLLKQTSVFSPCPRRQYLNITPNNLLQICTETDNNLTMTAVNETHSVLDMLLTQPVSCEPTAQPVSTYPTRHNLYSTHSGFSRNGGQRLRSATHVLSSTDNRTPVMNSSSKAGKSNPAATKIAGTARQSQQSVDDLFHDDDDLGDLDISF